MDKNPKCLKCNTVTTIEKKEETKIVFRCQNCQINIKYKKENGKWIIEGRWRKMSSLGKCPDCGSLLIPFDYEIIVKGKATRFKGVKCSKCKYQDPKK